MSGPGDVIAGLAPPQDNAPAYSPSGWPYQRREVRSGPEAGLVENTEAYGDEAGGDGVPPRQEAAAGAGNALAGYIRSSWARNKRARDVVEHRLLACLRA